MLRVIFQNTPTMHWWSRPWRPTWQTPTCTCCFLTSRHWSSSFWRRKHKDQTPCWCPPRLCRKARRGLTRGGPSWPTKSSNRFVNSWVLNKAWYILGTNLVPTWYLGVPMGYFCAWGVPMCLLDNHELSTHLWLCTDQWGSLPLCLWVTYLPTGYLQSGFWVGMYLWGEYRYLQVAYFP